MSPALERQRWLGALALAVALPLPLTGVVSLPFLAPYVAVAIALLVSRKVLRPLPTWSENVLALGIAVAVIAAGGLRYGTLRPVAHLAVLVAAVRMPGCFERRGAMSIGLVGLVAVAGIASSTHPLLAVYLLALLSLTVLAMARLQALSLAQASGVRPPWPPVRLVAVTVLGAILVGAPLFVLFPRLRSPFAAAPFGARSVSGFRDAVALHRIGDIKLSEALVLRIRFSGGGGVQPDWLRLAGATLRHYRGGMWVEGRKDRQRLYAGASRRVVLGEERASASLVRAEIELRKSSDVLFVPPGTVVLELPEGVPVWRDPGGGLHIPRSSTTPLRYAVEFDPALVLQPPPETEDLRVTVEGDELRLLGRRLTAGTGSPLAAAVSIEQYLKRTYGYSTKLDTPLRQDPVEWFLFTSRQGHCEFFASSMVMLLRSLEIPARLQVGFAGGVRARDGWYEVRDSNAHAWVVAAAGRAARTASAASASDDDGPSWMVFDPTPADGLPAFSLAAAGYTMRLRWQRVEQAWDRWVLTFSLADQLEGVQGGLRLLHRLSRSGWAWGVPALAVLGALLMVAGARRRLPRPARVVAAEASAISQGMRELIERSGQQEADGEADGVLTPRELERRLNATSPAGRVPLAWLVREHERACYGGGASPPSRRVRPAVRAVLRALSESARRAARPGSGSRR